MTTPVKKMLASGKLRRLNSDGSAKPCCYRLPCEMVIVDSESRLRRCHVGRLQDINGVPYQEKILLFVGETGAGKTTLINSFVNYYYGTQWDDEFRLVLITEEDEGTDGAARDQSESQTSWITAYTLHYQPHCVANYTVTLIDTPGYNDPRGVAYDEQTTGSLKKFFSLSSAQGGIDQIDEVGFVVLNSQHRYTTAQKYVFHSILSIFGKDIEENILLMTTHVDSTESKAVEAPKAGGIPFKQAFKFNNSVLFCTNEKKGQQENQDDYDSDDNEAIHKSIWKHNMSNMRRFFQTLNTLEPKSLNLTKEVLRQRQCLQTVLQNNREEINAGLNDLINLRKESEHIRRCNSTSNDNANMPQEHIISRKVQRIQLPKPERATNCDFCQRTCHYPCTQENQELWKCRAMNYHYFEIITTFFHVTSPRLTNCNVCPKNCPSASHTSTDYRYQYITEKEPLDLDRIRENHQSEGEALSLTELNLRVNEESAKARVKVHRSMIEANNIIVRLDEIALKPQIAEVNRLIEALIEEEMQLDDDGCKDRIDQLKHLLQHHRLIQEIRERMAASATPS